MKSGSLAIIIWKNKILLFHRDNKPDIPYPDHWQLPGGQIEPGESFRQCLDRELQEEVTYAPVDAKPFIKIPTDRGIAQVYLCFVGDDEAVKFKHGPGEGQEIGFFTVKQALQLKLEPKIKAALSSKDLVSKVLSLAR